MTHLLSLRFYFADKVSKYDNVPYAQLCERYDFSYYINENKMHLQKKPKQKNTKKKNQLVGKLSSCGCSALERMMLQITTLIDIN